MSEADIEILPGFNRADLTYLAESLEGQHGEGRVAESAPDAARFIRAALAISAQPVGAAAVMLSPEEQREVMKQRAHAERNWGDPA
jgi:hypothetical protein